MKAQTPHVCSVPDIDAILRDIESPDETVRASAVRLLCPCRSGWEQFKEHLPLIRQLPMCQNRVRRSSVTANAINAVVPNLSLKISAVRAECCDGAKNASLS